MNGHQILFWFLVCHTIWCFALVGFAKALRTKGRMDKKLANRCIAIIILVMFLEMLIIRALG